MRTKRAVLWIAVSSGAQAEDDQESLPEQTRRLQELAHAQGWQVVDTITVPGHSRVYFNYRDFAEAALLEGMGAPMRMFEHWKQRDFDVLACMSGDRFGREQSIFAEVVGRTIDAGAVVHTLRDGEINTGNKRMFVSMAGYQASVEIDELVRRHRFGMAKRARKGLPQTSWGHIYSHTTEGNGEQERTVVNEEARRMFMDVAELLLSGISWQQMPDMLASRGHTRASGRKLSASTLRKWLVHPTLWGNTAQHFQDDSKYPVGRGFWVFDASEPAPPHVTIHYGTHPSMYEGELASRVQAELRRRFGSNGKAQPQPRRKFSGLVVCGDCGYAAAYKQDGAWIGVRCVSRRNPVLRTDCTNTRYVNEKRLVDAARRLLTRLLNEKDWKALYEQENAVDAIYERLTLLDSELAGVQKRINMLMDQQEANPDEANNYAARITRNSEQKQTLLAERQRLTLLTEDNAPNADQRAALEAIRGIGLSNFWLLPPLEINQFLSRILGKRRFTIFNGDAVGTSSQAKKLTLPQRS